MSQLQPTEDQKRVPKTQKQVKNVVKVVRKGGVGGGLGGVWGEVPEGKTPAEGVWGGSGTRVSVGG